MKLQPVENGITEHFMDVNTSTDSKFQQKKTRAMARTGFGYCTAAHRLESTV